FVVYGTAGVDIVVALSRLKRRRQPFVKRIGRLNVIMRVHQNRRLACGVQPVGVDQGMPLSWDDLDVLHTDSPQLAGHERGRCLWLYSLFAIPIRRSSLATKSVAFCTSDLCSSSVLILGMRRKFLSSPRNRCWFSRA